MQQTSNTLVLSLTGLNSMSNKEQVSRRCDGPRLASLIDQAELIYLSLQSVFY